jgi:hypothetical protein
MNQDFQENLDISKLHSNLIEHCEKLILYSIQFSILMKLINTSRCYGDQVNCLYIKAIEVHLKTMRVYLRMVMIYEQLVHYDQN